MAEANNVVTNNKSGKWSEEPTDPIKQRSKNSFYKISGLQQRWPRPLPGAFLIPPALLVVADLRVAELMRFGWAAVQCRLIVEVKKISGHRALLSGVKHLLKR
jgi:hypothetical protein